MELHEAIATIRALADGVNPNTRKTLDATDACRQPQSVKALNRALAALVAQEDREKRSPANAGRAWSSAEDQQVCEELRHVRTSMRSRRHTIARSPRLPPAW